jgi:hypothetical protein
MGFARPILSDFPPQRAIPKLLTVEEILAVLEVIEPELPGRLDAVDFMSRHFAVDLDALDEALRVA